MCIEPSLKHLYFHLLKARKTRNRHLANEQVQKMNLRLIKIFALCNSIIKKPGEKDGRSILLSFCIFCWYSLTLHNLLGEDYYCSPVLIENFFLHVCTFKHRPQGVAVSLASSLSCRKQTSTSQLQSKSCFLGWTEVWRWCFSWCHGVLFPVCSLLIL